VEGDSVTRVAVTGLGTFLGRQLVHRLSAREDPPTVLGLDVKPPLRLLPNVTFHPIDLTEPLAATRLAEVLQAHEIEVLVHLAFRAFPSRDVDADHDLETLGSSNVLEACAEAGVRRLVIDSSTMVYGARPDNPNFLEETDELRADPGAPPVQNRLAVEHLVQSWRERNPTVDCTVLRRCWVMGPAFFDAVVALFDADWVPTVLGYDPLLQFVHEDDLLYVFERATLEPHPGVFNVVGRGVVPLSSLLANAGKWRLPVPQAWLSRAVGVASMRASGSSADALTDYLRFLWVADGSRGWGEFGEPLYSTREAWSAFVGARRMRQHV